MQFGKTLVTVG